MQEQCNAFCSCGHSTVSTVRCYNRGTGAVLVRWTCLVCDKVIYTHALDSNEMFIYMSWREWLADIRTYNRAYLALVEVSV